MKHTQKAFSLVELLIAIAITGGIGLSVFQLFQQNERVFHDENLIVEMQQNARAVASQIADEIRQAGQGVPVYASRFDAAPSEAVTAIMPLSTNSRLDFRAGLSNVEARVNSPLPVDCIVGVSTTLFVSTSAGFSPGDYVYVWGLADDGTWSWARSEVVSVATGSLTVVPRESALRSTRFVEFPTVSLDESISFQIAGSTIRRATASGSGWSAANEIGRNFSSMTFTYYDAANRVITPASLLDRASIASVDVRLVAQTSEMLSNGTRPNYAISLRTIPRNLRIR